MPMEDDKEGYRLIQARAEAAATTIGHTLADAIHAALNSLTAVSNIAKSELSMKSASPPATKKRPRRS